ncbi:hypothetical protein BV22DRAFT_1101534 [Leucogyrophana mollusca]|uniref:Uncharacterized protein n=1 Tax=Leucogyrophana mollusca TaxID=85980 RepID=A0ACB8BYX2_9AGAM|nr:hypothetical protein BV22DRAFT_1101534 [Leucogyrophana mollusca]
MDSDCAQCAEKLGELLSQLPVNNNGQTWRDIELTAQSLANQLRVRDTPEDNHTALGKTQLPQVLTSLLTSALNGSSVPDADHTTPVYEILRVGANLCVEHDPNRGQLLDAGFPQAIVSLLEGYADTVPSGPLSDPLPLSIPNLQVAKTAIGVLLNASVNYAPVKFRLISLEVAMTLIRLSSAIYPTASWMRSLALNSQESAADQIAESWSLRSGLSSWAWRLIAELRDDSHPLFDPDVLPYLIPSLVAFTPPMLTSPPPPPFSQPSQLRTSLLQADFDLLAESCSHIESLALDVEDVRLSLARGFQFPAEHNGVACFSAMLDFIEIGNYAPLWYVQGDASLENSLFEVRSKEKAFDDCKAAIIKAVVEVSGEDKNVDVLCDDSEEGKPGGDFVSRLVSWIRAFVSQGSGGNARDDLAICATLSLGNLTRREFHSTILLSPPHNIAQLLSTDVLLSPSADIKLKHGVIGLLKHLSQSSSQSPTNRAALTSAGVVERIVASGVWDDRSDVMADIVQVNAIGVVKHLCSNSVDNSLALIFPGANQESSSTGLAQLLSLVKRSDTIAIKSEGTRVLVNVIRSLWSSETTSEQSGSDGAEERQRKREQAIDALLIPSCAEALAALIGRSTKYPILVNEGVVALSLLSTHRSGGPLVLNAILAPLPIEATPSMPGSTPMSATASASSETDSPVVTSPAGTRGRSALPRRALDHLVLVLRNSSGSDGSASPHRPTPVAYPIEIRANICALLGQMAKTTSGVELDIVKESTRPILDELARNTQAQGREGMLSVAAKRVLDVWTSE